MPVKDPNALAKLQAYAMGGQSGVDAWNRSQAVANQAQQAALSTAGSVATNGAAEQAALSKIVGDYTSPSQGALASGASFAATNDANYARAAQSELDRNLSQLNAKQAQADAKRKLDLELAQQDYDLGMTKVRNENDLTQRQANQLTAAQVNDAIQGAGPLLQQADREKASDQITAAQMKAVGDENAQAELDLLRRSVENINSGKGNDNDRRRATELAKRHGLDVASLTQGSAASRFPQMTADQAGKVYPTQTEDLSVYSPEEQQRHAAAVAANPSLGLPPETVAARDAQVRALDEMLKQRGQAAEQSQRDVGALADQYGLVQSDQRSPLEAFEGALAGDKGTRFDKIDQNPMLYMQQAAEAGGINPMVARGMFPSTPLDQFKQQQALDAMRDYDAKRQLAEDKRDVQGDKTDRTQQINDLAEATGLDPTAVQSLVTKTKLPPDKLGTVLRDDQSLSELQQAVDAALGNGTTYTEFMNSMRDQLTAKQKAGQMPEGMTVTDYLNFIGANYRDQFTQLGLTGG